MAKFIRKESKRKDYRPKYQKKNNFYHTTKWRKFSIMFRHQQIYCAACERETFIGKGSRGAVDHVIPLVKGGARWNEDNLLGLCISCHSTKTYLDNLKSVPLIPYIRREDGLVPVNKMKIVELIRRTF